MRRRHVAAALNDLDPGGGGIGFRQRHHDALPVAPVIVPGGAALQLDHAFQPEFDAAKDLFAARHDFEDAALVPLVVFGRNQKTGQGNRHHGWQFSAAAWHWLGRFGQRRGSSLHGLLLLPRLVLLALLRGMADFVDSRAHRGGEHGGDGGFL